MTGSFVTTSQKEAIEMLRQCGGEGHVSSSGSAVLDGEAYIDYRTVGALEIKGLIERDADTLSQRIHLLDRKERQ